MVAAALKNKKQHYDSFVPKPIDSQSSFGRSQFFLTKGAAACAMLKMEAEEDDRFQALVLLSWAPSPQPMNCFGFERRRRKGSGEERP